MGYLVFVLFLLLLSLLIYMLFRGQEQFSKRSSVILLSCIVALVALIGLYNILQSKQNEEIEQLQKTFLQGGDIICYDKSQAKDYVVNKTYFNFNVATRSVLGKPQTEYNHLVLPLSECKQSQKDSPQ